ncbi:hypothetical protein HOY80DRAFT_1135830 [Tuber brumale]|nr:hypothetical protein HOY80DRAFT_1135830 [Tuber brumale]
MPTIITRSLSFLKITSTLPKSPEEENRPSTSYEIDEFLRCLPPSPPTPPSAQRHHRTPQHSPNTSTSSTIPTSAVILPPSPPPTDVPPVPPPSYSSLERGYYSSAACASSLPHVHVHFHEHVPILAHVRDTQEEQPQHRRSTSREKNRLLNLRVETDLDSGRRNQEPVLVYHAPRVEEPRRIRQEEIVQWSWV